jgi:hypothetical protein
LVVRPHTIMNHWAKTLAGWFQVYLGCPVRLAVSRMPITGYKNSNNTNLSSNISNLNISSSVNRRLIAVPTVNLSSRNTSHNSNTNNLNNSNTAAVADSSNPSDSSNSRSNPDLAAATRNRSNSIKPHSNNNISRMDSSRNSSANLHKCRTPAFLRSRPKAQAWQLAILELDLNARTTLSRPLCAGSNQRHLK